MSTSLNTKIGQVRFLKLESIRPSPENDELYRRIDPDDLEIKALAKSIKKHGLKEPLVVTADGYIVSGHRRYVACLLAGLIKVPCRIESIRRVDDLSRFTELLREYNRQRIKSFDERLREELVTVDPTVAYQALVADRQQRSLVEVAPLAIVGNKQRAKISPAKQPMLNAVMQVLERRREYWPLSDRQIHYALLNAPPLRHASKPASRYANDHKSYHDLTDLLTRARIEGWIEMAAIADETRPVTIWSVFQEPGLFVRHQLNDFLRGYWRDLLQSQPNHIEVVAEKNTIAPLCKLVCQDYCVPLTSGRGYCSLPPRYEMVQRYRKSGKTKLVLLLLSDFDPDGEEIAHSLARSLRDDFGVANIHPIKVALTAEQVQRFQLPPSLEAKASSSNHAKFIAKHGRHVWELEALEPEALQKILREAIESVLDRSAYDREVAAEQQDAGYLQTVRRTVLESMQSMTEASVAAGDIPKASGNC